MMIYCLIHLSFEIIFCRQIIARNFSLRPKHEKLMFFFFDSSNVRSS